MLLSASHQSLSPEAFNDHVRLILYKCYLLFGVSLCIIGIAKFSVMQLLVHRI